MEMRFVDSYPSKKGSFAGWIVIRNKTRIAGYQGDWFCLLDVVKVRAYFFATAVFEVSFMCKFSSFFRPH